MDEILNRDRGTNGEKGTGLGLTICKELLARNGGQTEVMSLLNKGFNFFLYAAPFPLNPLNLKCHYYFLQCTYFNNEAH